MRLLSLDAQALEVGRTELAQLIESAQADLACVHGAPHLARWRSRCAAIARMSGMVVVGGGGPGAGANLLLSALRVEELGYRDCPLDGGSRRAPAGAALGLVRAAGAELVVASATFVGNSARRVAQARELLSALGRLSAAAPPALVSVRGADRPGTATWQAMAAGRSVFGGRVFVDSRVVTDPATQLDRAPQTAESRVAPVVLELSV